MTAFLYSWSFLRFSLGRHCVILLLLPSFMVFMVQRGAEMCFVGLFSGPAGEHWPWILHIPSLHFNDSRLQHQTHTHLVQIRYAWRPHCKKWQRLLVPGRLLDVFTTNMTARTWAKECVRAEQLGSVSGSVRVSANTHRFLAAFWINTQPAVRRDRLRLTRFFKRWTFFAAHGEDFTMCAARPRLLTARHWRVVWTRSHSPAYF